MDSTIPWVKQPFTPAPFGLSIGALVEEYLADCRRRGLSPKTVDFAYGYPLRHVFLPWCRRAGITDPASLSSWFLDRFVSELLLEGGKEGLLARQSVITYVRTVNQFLTWAARAGAIEHLKASQPRGHRRLVDVLSRQEIQRIEDMACRERDRLIVRILADTGLRLGELVSLRPESVIDREGHQYLHVIGKGQRDRLVPLAPTLHERLARYVGATRPNCSESAKLFLAARRSRGGRVESLGASGVTQMIGTLAKIAGIRKRVYPHLFRHSFATWALSRGMNPVQLKDILGHSSLVMITNIYSHLAPEDAYVALMAAMEC
jgi:integrase/recombinase XerD